VGEGNNTSAGVTAIQGAGSTRGGEDDDKVPLMMDARGEKVGAWVGWGARA